MKLAHAEAPRAARRRDDGCRRERSRSAGSRPSCRRDADRSGPGVSIEASFCRMTPTGLSALAAAWAPAIDCGRPSVSGATMPGNSTAFRVGKRMSAPSGRLSSALPPGGAASCAACSGGTIVSRASVDCIGFSISFMSLRLKLPNSFSINRPWQRSARDIHGGAPVWRDASGAKGRPGARNIRTGSPISLYWHCAPWMAGGGFR